jgi:hypothetical protein
MAGIRSSGVSSPYRSATACSSRLGHDLRPQPVHQTTASLRSAGSGMRNRMAYPAPHPAAAPAVGGVRESARAVGGFEQDD